jgi:hypothetical protein
MVLLAACQQPARSTPEVEPEEAGPAEVAAARSTVVDLDGAPRDPLAADAPGVTVLVFVSTECPISNRYAPAVQGLADGWTSAGVRPWLVYPDPDDDAAAIRIHQADYGLHVPTVRDPEHVLVKQAGVIVTPEAAVFERGATEPAYVGRIDDRVAELGKVRAEASRHDLRDAVRAVQAGRSPAAAGAAAIGCTIADLR